MPLTDHKLVADELCVHFEGVKAVDGVSVSVSQNHILGLIGPNGAGKTTLVNALSGFQRATSGSMSFGGVDITRWGPGKRARHGIVRTFQDCRLFANLTAWENVEAGAIGAGAKRREARQVTATLLRQFDLYEVSGRLASELPLGAERKLGIARALASRPVLLFLDEPAAGLNESESEELLKTLRRVRERFELGLLVIEHDMGLIMRLCDEVHVLNYGQTLTTGSPEAVRADPTVIEAYLGS